MHTHLGEWRNVEPNLLPVIGRVDPDVTLVQSLFNGLRQARASLLLRLITLY